MILTPEQEVLVEEVARVISGAPFPSGRSQAKARAIIPLIYTAGHRAGIEAAAVIADEMAEGARVLHNAAGVNRDIDGLYIHGEAWRVSKHTAFAIRSISEQEKSRG